MSSPRSPFASVRWEGTSPRLYFLSSDIRKLVEEPDQAYVIGSRGSGKTTILQALNWKERLDNASLRAQIGDPFAAGHLGIYLKLPDHQFDQLERWLGEGTDLESYAAVVSMYLDLLWLPLLIQALDGLRQARVLGYGVDDERAIVEQIMDGLPDLYFAARPDSMRAPTIRNLRRALEAVRELIVSTARRKTSPEDLLDLLRAGGPGQFGRSVASKLMELCPPASTGDAWKILVCLDEGEGLKGRQQLVLNTMVRHAEFPVRFIVAFVARPREDTRTINEKIHLQRADRDLVFRDEPDNRTNQFQELAEGVATLRVRQRLGSTDVVVNLNTMLGKLDFDSVLVDILKASDKAAAKELLAKATELAGVDEVPKVRQAWLQQLGLDREEGLEGDEKRRKSSGRRRSSSTVVLSVCSRLNLKPRYASAEMLLSLSDWCVRDFLWQMNELFQASNLELTEFLSTPISIDRQNRALVAASEKKAAGIEEWLVVAPDSGRKVVEGLARLTAELQRRRAHDKPLEAESGLFDLVGEGAVVDKAVKYIRDASEAGYLKLQGDPPEKIRIHLSLAPTFGASYRKAYRVSQLQADEVEAFANASDDDELIRLSQSTATRIAAGWLENKLPAQRPPELPFAEPSDDR